MLKVHSNDKDYFSYISKGKVAFTYEEMDLCIRHIEQFYDLSKPIFDGIDTYYYCVDMKLIDKLKI